MCWQKVDFSFHLFSNGSLAFTLMRMLLARLVWEFDIELLDSSELNYRWGLLQIAPSMPMRITSRHMWNQNSYI